MNFYAFQHQGVGRGGVASKGNWEESDIKEDKRKCFKMKRVWTVRNAAENPGR